MLHSSNLLKSSEQGRWGCICSMTSILHTGVELLFLNTMVTCSQKGHEGTVMCVCVFGGGGGSINPRTQGGQLLHPSSTHRINFLRLNILKVLQVTEKHLNKITSVDEFLRRIYAVIHSNDPIARAVTLRSEFKIAVQ